MENKNNNFANQKISFFPLLFLPPPLKEKHNLLENYNIIHYNGVTMPRISLYSPFFINTFATPIVKNGFNRAINTNTNTSKDPELIIELKEKENKKSEIGNDYSNCFKMSNVNELNLHEEKNNGNNYNLIEQGKNCNFLKSIDFINNIGKINQQKMLINNKSNNYNQGIFHNNNDIINSINNCPINVKIFENNTPFSFKEIQNKSNENTSLKLFKIQEDTNSIPSTNNSKEDKTKKLKSLFVVNEMLNSEIKKEENETKDQTPLLSNKRGRKQNKNNNKKTHEATDDDNIHRKIQVHYISFITHFINDSIKTFIKSRNAPTFKNIDYQLKKIVNQRYFQDLKTKKIADVLKMRPSPKMKNHEISVNEEIYNKVCRLCPFLNEIFEQNFMTFFKEYYYNKNKNYIINGREIILSDKTKNFNDLINKNYAYKEKIKFIVLNNFFEDNKAYEKIRFKTDHESNNETNTE